jgi:Flp pilus assembly pilin Flp
MWPMHGWNGLRRAWSLGGSTVRLPGSAAGQGVVEYGLILVLTVVFTVVILGVFGGTVSDVLSLIANAIDAATGGG